MARSKSPTPGSIHQIKVTLKGARPPIWRRLLVRSDTRLPELHGILQRAMGWGDCHLHQFEVGGQHFGVPDPNGWDEIRSERTISLKQIAPGPKARFIYEYDFGDGWEHAIEVEKIVTAEAGVIYPRCLAGRRACPPDDVGGIWGYAAFLETIQDPNHEEHEDLLNWVGGQFDPEAFDLAAINAQLRMPPLDLRWPPRS